MTSVTTAVVTTHLGFAALWTGAVVFFTASTLQRGLAGGIDAEPLGAVAARLRTVSRVSALALFLTGGHMAGTRYTVDSLTGSGRGHLVLAMLALWFVLAVLVEVGGGRVQRGTDDLKVREPARGARLVFYVASVASVALLIVAGLLASP